jgi:hypothetical protein
MAFSLIEFNLIHSIHFSFSLVPMKAHAGDAVSYQHEPIEVERLAIKQQRYDYR